VSLRSCAGPCHARVSRFRLVLDTTVVHSCSGEALADFFFNLFRWQGSHSTSRWARALVCRAGGSDPVFRVIGVLAPTCLTAGDRQEARITTCVHAFLHIRTTEASFTLVLGLALSALTNTLRGHTCLCTSSWCFGLDRRGLDRGWFPRRGLLRLGNWIDATRAFLREATCVDNSHHA